MKMSITKPQGVYNCTHCESLGEVTFSAYEREQNRGCVKLRLRNLPEGITETGIKNLFLTVGAPVSISYNELCGTAFVEFNCLRQAELAVRDLHGKPPYYLKVTKVTPKSQNVASNEKTESDAWFSQPLVSRKPPKHESGECSKVYEVAEDIKNRIKNLCYDPSIRMRQKILDFKSEVECVSLGRGYLNMGDRDRFVGGLQKFTLASENSTAKEMMKFSCENCGASTVKSCGTCSASYCSETCMNLNHMDHATSCSAFDANDIFTSWSPSDFEDTDFISLQVPLTSGSIVVMSTYFTMQTVAVRICEEPWQEAFTNLCNDVAAAALKGEIFKEMPKVGDAVLARYDKDLCYYRAKILSQDEEKFRVVFIDFGNEQETPLHYLKPIPGLLKAAPTFAVKVRLKGVPDDSSPDSVNYFNLLTAGSIPLILVKLKVFDEETNEVTLTEKTTKKVVNDVVTFFSLPSWKRDEAVLFKTGDVYYSKSIPSKPLTVGSRYNLFLSHFDEKEFLDSEVFFVTYPETDDYLHVKSQMYLKIQEYCDYLKDDSYLPRVNELCLAKDGGDWHRCINLKSQKTTCCLFFLDDGHSSLIETSNIRRMIVDFTEAPSQAICCTLPDDPKLKTNKEVLSKAVSYLKESVGQTIESVMVSSSAGDAYCLSLPEIDKILSSEQE